MGRAGVLGPLYWEEDPSLDLDYHIRHSALPKPGRFRELFALVSRLHGTLLDRNRPLWEMHLIEGLPERKFAVYSKFHHAAIDGARSIHLVQSMYSTDPKARTHDSPLSIEAGERYRAELEQHRADNASAGDTRRSIIARLRGDLTSRLHLLGALGEYGNALIGRKPTRHRHLDRDRTEIGKAAQGKGHNRTAAFGQFARLHLKRVLEAARSAWMLANRPIPARTAG